MSIKAGESFEEQLERIRDIRASELRFYQKSTDIYSQCSADYDVESPITKKLFATVQNKFHYPVTHHTAAEIVYVRTDSTKPNLGLTTLLDTKEYHIEKYGWMRQAYLKEHRPILYTDLIITEKLFLHLEEIDIACRERLEIIETAMMKQEGVTEALKAADQMACPP